MVHVPACRGDVVGPRQQVRRALPWRRVGRAASRESVTTSLSAPRTRMRPAVCLPEVQIGVERQAHQRAPIADDEIADRTGRRTGAG